ncbi:MAG: hypothetical protein ABJK37_09205 [Paraglaciecola sp.]|uniref:hypothetical protein n=1 Tax=Paraglaciecola sp. TaxID=1920173 RepID=UPI00329A04F8
MNIFSSKNEKIIFVAIIAFCLGLLVGLLPKVDSKTLIGAVVTLITAFAGAFFAFKLNSDKDAQYKKVDETAKLNRSLIHLGVYLNVIGNIKKTLNTYGSIHEQAFIMPPIKNYNDNILFDISDISLILSEEPQLLLELSVENDGYIQTLESVKTRHEFFMNELQPLMIELGLMHRKVNTLELEQKLPKHIFNAAYQAVNLINSNISSTEKGLLQVSVKLKAVCHKKCPGYKFADFLI